MEVYAAEEPRHESDARLWCGEIDGEGGKDGKNWIVEKVHKNSRLKAAEVKKER